MKIHKDIKQGTDDWFRIRRGVLTASNYKDALTPTGNLADSKTFRKFIGDLALECFVDKDPHKEEAQRRLSYKFDIYWGKAHEDEARDWFSENYLPVETVGFIEHDFLPIGCSPDGLIPAEGNRGWEYGLEIKCPSLSKHVSYLKEGVLPNDPKEGYHLQVHGSMALTGLDAWYFMSYYPNEKIRNFVIKVERNEFTEKVEQSLIDFVDLYRAEFARLEPIIKAESGVAA